MKLDRRVRYTRTALKESLIEMMETRPIQKISVKSLCERADINRATFYTHYSDTYDLLDQIEAELFESIRAAVERDKLSANLHGVLIEVCRQVQRHADLCRVLFSPNGNKDFLEKILKFTYAKSLESWQEMFPRTAQYQLDWTYAFFAHGSINVIARWVQTDMKEDPEEIAQFIESMINASMQWMNRQDRGPAGGRGLSGPDRADKQRKSFRNEVN